MKRAFGYVTKYLEGRRAARVVFEFYPSLFSATLKEERAMGQDHLCSGAGSLEDVRRHRFLRGCVRGKPTTGRRH